jgi:dTDP-4-dehydrorhamnose reductase
VLAAETLANFVAPLEAVIHCAAWVHRAAATAAARAECFAVNLGMTQTLIAALERAGGRRALAFVSTVAVYGERFHAAVETRPPAPASTYATSKLGAEREVIAADARGAIRGVVLRPAVVYGVGAPGNTARLLALVRRGTVPLVAGGANQKSVVHVEDLCASAALAIEPATARPDARSTSRASRSAYARCATRWRRASAAPSAGCLAGGATQHRHGARPTRASGGRLPDLGRSLDVFMGEATVDTTAITTTLGARFRPSAEGFAAMARGETRPA